MVLVTCLRPVQAEQQNILAVEPTLDCIQIGQGPHKKTSPRHQQHRNCDLGNDQNMAQSKRQTEAACPATRLAYPDLFQRRYYYQLVRVRVQGVSPRNYPFDLTNRLALSRGRPDMRLAFADALMKYAIDRGDLSAAEKWRKRADELFTSGGAAVENLVHAELGCFDLLFRKRHRIGGEEAIGRTPSRTVASLS
jgi:hypothetical protein